MLLKTDTKIYEVNFGLKGLILYSQYSNQLAELNQPSFLLYCGLVSHYPDITLDEINHIISQCDLSLLTPPPYLSPFTAEGLYAKAVGEMGLDPSVVEKMTPKEIDLAYEGYLRRQETTANLTKLAVAEVLNNNTDLIRLTEDKGYTVGSEEERQETFKKLGIE